MEKSFYEQLCHEEKSLRETLDAVLKLKARYSPNGEITKNTSNDKSTHRALSANHVSNLVENSDFPSEYSNNLTQKQKTMIALNKIKKGTADDVANALVELDEEIGIMKAKQMATYHLSLLYRDKLIGANTTGAKYEYFIRP